MPVRFEVRYGLVEYLAISIDDARKRSLRA